jgi:UDP-N-acetylmuramoylalanine--D-glutamate ligase
MKKEILLKIFRHKKITQMGLGILGRGVGDALFLAENESSLHITDVKKKEFLMSSLEKLSLYSSLTFRLGEHKKEDFEERDLILKGAGVPYDSPFILHAREKKVPVDMSASLFARIAPSFFIGITGTRGKSTVTHFVQEIFKKAGKKVLLGGNVLGVSNLQLLKKAEKDHTAIFEIDSWQAQGFAEEQSLQSPFVRQGPFSPHITVFTSFMNDHLNYYRGDSERYFLDKANLFLYQEEGDILIAGRQILPFLSKYKARIKSTVCIADEKTLPSSWTLKTKGIHNRYNAGIALCVAQHYGIEDEISRNALENAEPLLGRLSLVREKNGVKIYNDTNATMPEATLAGLSALYNENTCGKKNIILIAGGMSKNIPLSSLEALSLGIEKYVKHLILIEGSGTDELSSCLSSSVFPYYAESLEDACRNAFEKAEKGESILFSPGFASFNSFKNEYDRGDHFNRLISLL